MDFIDTIPLWAVFLLTALILASAFEGGYRAGLSLDKKDENAKKAPVGAMIGVVLSLSAFILAFTFGVASGRFNDRRVLVIKEANAIGTTFLRSELLPDENRDEAKKLLRQYVGIRLRLLQEKSINREQLMVGPAVTESKSLQKQLWGQAVSAGKSNPNSPTVALFIDSLNETIDLQAERVTAALHARLPGMVWVVLYLLISFGMFGLGYQFGLVGKRNKTISSIALLSFAMVMMMIADLDRPLEGFMYASKQPFLDLGEDLGISDSYLSTIMKTK